jgi:hypothetical protein
MSGLVTSGRQKYRRVLIVVDSGRFISGNIEHNLFSNGNGINYVSYYSSFVSILESVFHLILDELNKHLYFMFDSIGT